MTERSDYDYEYEQVWADSEWKVFRKWSRSKISGLKVSNFVRICRDPKLASMRSWVEEGWLGGSGLDGSKTDAAKISVESKKFKVWWMSKPKGSKVTNRTIVMRRAWGPMNAWVFEGWLARRNK